MSRMVLLVVAAALSGCVSYHWTKPGTSQQDFVTQDYECNKESDSYLHPTFNGGIMYDRCMQANGWMPVRD